MRPSRSKAVAPFAAVLLCTLASCHGATSHAGVVTPPAADPVSPYLPLRASVPSTRPPEPSASVELVTPPAPPSSTCGMYGLVAETTKSYTYLLDCSGGTLSSPPRLHIAVGGRLVVAGDLAKEASVRLTTKSQVLRLSGSTAIGARAGTAEVSVRGIPCFSETDTEPDECPLFMVTVSQ